MSFFEFFGLSQKSLIDNYLPEVIASGGSSLFGNLVIATFIDFVIIKGDAIQGFKEPTVLAEELVCKRSGFQ